MRLVRLDMRNQSINSIYLCRVWYTGNEDSLEGNFFIGIPINTNVFGQNCINKKILYQGKKVDLVFF